MDSFIIPWKRGKSLVRDVTFPDTLTPSYQSHASREAGVAAAEAEKGKVPMQQCWAPSGLLFDFCVCCMCFICLSCVVCLFCVVRI